jgi:peroxiredoxin (alkyl hydroperoxide reductase subunit C)
MPAEIGAPAPAFTLRNPAKQEVSLDDFKGRKTLVVFIPFPFTGNCTDEVCELRDNLAQLGDLDSNVVVINCDTPFANGAWAEQNGLDFPVLSDFWPHGEVAQAYGAFNEATGSANRITFVLDAEGIVREIIDSGSLAVVREYDSYVEALQGI